ncbi:MAG: hypothetical protein ABIP63_00500 [Thermoanaerobaculia bacterium]
MTYSPALLVHICAGILAVASGSAALAVRKGSPLHRRSGIVFSVSMLLMAGGGAYLAMMKGQRFNILAGTFTFYLVATGWLTVRRKANETGRLERVLLLLALIAGTTGWIFAWQDAARVLKPGKFAPAYFIFGLIAFSSAAGDIRMLVRGGVSGAQRLLRHVWRMGFALFIAAGSFFLGTSSDPVMKKLGLRAVLFTDLRATHLPEVPVVIIVLLTLFWVFRIRFSNTYRKAAQQAGANPTFGSRPSIRSSPVSAVRLDGFSNSINSHATDDIARRENQE